MVEYHLRELCDVHAGHGRAGCLFRCAEMSPLLLLDEALRPRRRDGPAERLGVCVRDQGAREVPEQLPRQ